MYLYIYIYIYIYINIYIYTCIEPLYEAGVHCVVKAVSPVTSLLFFLNTACVDIDLFVLKKVKFDIAENHDPSAKLFAAP
jgi:hypothetical protein